MTKVNLVKVFSFSLTALFAFFVNFVPAIQAQTASNVEDLVKTISEGKLQVETKATPYKLVADFNGDKIEDVAVIVSLSDKVENISTVVNIEYPYYFGKEVDADDLALFIIHGEGNGWQFEQKSSVLILGRSSALIFQKSRLDEPGDGMKLGKDKCGKVNVNFITEGSDGTLKWNGKKYVWTESDM